ncbi:MAG: mechanosensitive ion channel family protein, partial [Campylobacterota bacterium]|nr:mechanosensitive ion channel family protein [Campylobacterota bacterium]
METSSNNTTLPIEKEETISLNVIDRLDMDLHTTAQSLLHPVYEKFPFLSSSIFDIPLGNLIMAFLVFFFILLLRQFVTFVVMGCFQYIARYTTTYYDDRVISALKAPIRFAIVIIGLHLFFLLIFKETVFIKNVLNTLIVYDIFWAMLAVAEALRGLVYSFSKKLSHDLFQEVGNFILSIIKIIIASIGLGAMLQVWGINVTALVASLGIGGLAFALAAKDAASNLFGSFSLLADKSIGIGEWIKVDGVEGTVEDIGMRTTKIRSFEKSLITVPNQIVANNPIENFSRRGVRRIKINLGLTYNTSSSQIHTIINEIKFMLHNHENISQKETLLVNFNALGDSALNIFIYTFTNTSNWENYLNIREDIHLKIMKIVEENNSSFA